MVISFIAQSRLGTQRLLNRNQWAHAKAPLSSEPINSQTRKLKSHAVSGTGQFEQFCGEHIYSASSKQRPKHELVSIFFFTMLWWDEQSLDELLMKTI